VPPGLILPAALRDLEPQHHVVAEHVTQLICGHLEQGRVGSAGAGDQVVVDRGRQPVEEPLQRRRVGGIERRGAARVDVARRLLEALGIAAGKDDVGALAAGASGGLEPDAGAAADEGDGLAEQLGLALSRNGGGHDPSDMLAICASIGARGRGLSAISMRSAITAVS
jgi:hypothetical protein